MSIFNAIANAGQNAGAPISNYFANKYQVDRDKMLDQEAQQQNAMLMEDRQRALKKDLFEQAVTVYAGGGDPVAWLNTEGPKYGINEPADASLMPYFEGALARSGNDLSADERLMAHLPPDQRAAAVKVHFGLKPKAENFKPQRPVQVVGEDGVPRWVDPSEAIGQIAGGAEIGPDFDTEQKLRKELDSLTKEFRQQELAMGRIISSAEAPSAAGDLALIFNYMKMLDPGSTVREGEFANAQNAAGVPGRIVSLYNNIKSGERLNPVQRADFLSQAGRIYKGASESYKTTLTDYQGLAQEYGASPQRVGIRGPRYDESDFAFEIKPGHVEDGYRFKGGDPGDETNWEKAK